MAALPGGIRTLFESAFAPAAARGGRPDAARWTTELATLGASLQKCPVNAAHWYAPVAARCPWCEVEASSGVALFPAVFVSGQGGGIVLLWQEIQAVPDPGPLRALVRPEAAAAPLSPHVQAAARRMRTRKMLAATTLVLGMALVLAVVPAESRIVAVLAVLALAAGLWRLGRPREMGEVRTALEDAGALWAQLEARWEARPGRPVRRDPPDPVRPQARIRCHARTAHARDAGPRLPPPP